MMSLEEQQKQLLKDLAQQDRRFVWAHGLTCGCIFCVLVYVLTHFVLYWGW